MTTMVIRAAIAEPTTVIVVVARLIRARLLIICMPLDPSCRSLSTHVEDCPLLVATPSARVTFTCREGEQIVTFCCRSSGGSLGVPQTPKAGRGERLAAVRTHGLRDYEVDAFIGEADAMRYDLVVRSRRAVLPDGTRPAAVAVSGPVITAVGEYGARYDAGRDVDLGDLGAAARPGRQPRACQRARPDRVGGFRDRHPGGGGRRGHHDLRHAAELAAAHHLGGGAGGKARGGGREMLGGRGVLGRCGARQPGRCAAARGRGGRVQVLPARLRRARVPAARRGGPAVRAR